MEKPVLKNDIDVKIEGVQKITDNIAEIKEYALETKKYYENLVFNDEQVKEAKDERAGINKTVKKVADYRKDTVDLMYKLKNTKKRRNRLRKKIARHYLIVLLEIY